MSSKKEEQYARSTLDTRKLTSYARKVAQAALNTVPLATHQEHVYVDREVRSGFFGRKVSTVRDRKPQGSQVQYWDLGRVVSEMFRRQEKIGPYQDRWWGVEEGTMVILTSGGELRYVEYRVSAGWDHYPRLIMDDDETNWKVMPMQEGHFTALDRPNLGRMREKRYKRKAGIVFEEDLERNFQVTVHQKGLGLSLALNHLMKRAS